MEGPANTYSSGERRCDIDPRCDCWFCASAGWPAGLRALEAWAIATMSRLTGVLRDPEERCVWWRPWR
jgi:hypothetical protein